eukprot:GFYU01022511.1.p1 GENE.GFYU01022511.1~~GFYU01022511.1.p1  ORF type:complete len:307 (-),score=29.76 GFYU01022511.1:318-1238(-)
MVRREGDETRLSEVDVTSDTVPWEKPKQDRPIRVSSSLPCYWDYYSERVSRLTTFWNISSGVTVPVCIFLIKHSTKDYTLIDCGSATNRGEILKEISDAVGDQYALKRLLITHGHLDHVGNLEYFRQHFPEMRVYIHAKELEFLQGSKYKDLSAASCNSFSFFKCCLQESNLNVDDGSVRDGFVLVGSEQDNGEAAPVKDLVPGIQFIHTPGHTPGSTCFYLDQEKFLFVGDCLTNVATIRCWCVCSQPKLEGAPPLATPDPAQNMASMARLVQLYPDVETVFPAHDSTTHAITRERFAAFCASNR